jgi:hypothetical protein
MSRVSFTADALRELRERIASCKSPNGISIVGPIEDGAWPADTLEEAWLVEKLYGRRPRWVILLMPLEVLSERSKALAPKFHVEDVCGIHVEVLTAEPVPRLSVALHGDAIRVCEVPDDR